MTIKLLGEGPLAFSEIIAEFGGTLPHNFSEYYGVAAGIPTSGVMKISDFYGKSKFIPAPVILTGGTTYYTVPANVTTLSIDALRGGGGGGGGNDSSGNTYRRGCGGSGGEVAPFNLAVTPGEVLTMVVGAGGLRASGHYNYSWFSQTPGNEGNTVGLTGGTTAIYRGATLLAQATGGAGGGPQWGGAGGIPNGVAGDYRALGNNFFTLLGNAGGPPIGGVRYGHGGCSNHSQVYYIYSERNNNSLSGGDGWPGVIAFRPRLIGEDTGLKTFSKTSVGTMQWTVPANVKMLTARIQGGGSGAAGIEYAGQNTDTENYPGGINYYDGFNASMDSVLIPVSPGDVCTLTVGAGGGELLAGYPSTLTVRGISYIAAGGPKPDTIINYGIFSSYIDYPVEGQKKTYGYNSGKGGTPEVHPGIRGLIEIRY